MMFEAKCGCKEAPREMSYKEREERRRVCVEFVFSSVRSCFLSVGGQSLTSHRIMTCRSAHLIFVIETVVVEIEPWQLVSFLMRA
jgi:hypothetical protein